MESNEMLNRILERETFLKEVVENVKEDIKDEEEFIIFDDSFLEQLQSKRYGEKLNILESLNDEDIIIMIALIDFVRSHASVKELLDNIEMLKSFFSKHGKEERRNQVDELFEKRGIISKAINEAYYTLKTRKN